MRSFDHSPKSCGSIPASPYSTKVRFIMRKVVQMLSLIAAIGVSGVAHAAYPDGFGFFEPFPGTIDDPIPTGVWWNQFYIDPSVQTEDNAVNFNGVFISHDFMSCVDADTGKFISCTYTYQVKGLDDASDSQIPFNGELTSTDTYGGHFLHTSSSAAHPQPFIYVPPIPQSPVLVTGGTVDTNGGDPTGATTVTGSTGLGMAEFTIGQPEAAGTTWIEGTLVLPKGWICLAGCADFKTTITHETIVREVGGFQQLPTPVSGVDVYAIARNSTAQPPQGDPGHSDADATWGEPQTIAQFKAIAQKYYDFSPIQAKLQINDISLPHGGLFDIHDDWNLNYGGFSTPHAHQDHRNGMAFDLNTTDTQQNPIACDASESDPYTIKGIVREQDFDYSPGSADLPLPQQPIAVVCETPSPTTGLQRVHINVTAPTPLQILQELDLLPPPQQGLVP